MKDRESIDPRHIWEGQIRHMNDDIEKAIKAGKSKEIIEEMERLKQFIVATYRLRFGDHMKERID